MFFIFPCCTEIVSNLDPWTEERPNRDILARYTDVTVRYTPRFDTGTTGTKKEIYYVRFFFIYCARAL